MEKFKLTVVVDVPLFDKTGLDDPYKKTFELTRCELLKLWRDFRKWILVQIKKYMFNKRHIVCLYAPWWEDSIQEYLNKVIELWEEPSLQYNTSEEWTNI